MGKKVFVSKVVALLAGTLTLVAMGRIPLAFAETVVPKDTENLGSIKVTSTPPGAKVYLDRLSKGVTPIVLRFIKPGKHTIRLEKPGHFGAVKEIFVSA